MWDKCKSIEASSVVDASFRRFKGGCMLCYESVRLDTAYKLNVYEQIFHHITNADAYTKLNIYIMSHYTHRYTPTLSYIIYNIQYTVYTRSHISIEHMYCFLQLIQPCANTCHTIPMLSSPITTRYRHRRPYAAIDRFTVKHTYRAAVVAVLHYTTQHSIYLNSE